MRTLTFTITKSVLTWKSNRFCLLTANFFVKLHSNKFKKNFIKSFTKIRRLMPIYESSLSSRQNIIVRSDNDIKYLLFLLICIF